MRRLPHYKHRFTTVSKEEMEMKILCYVGGAIVLLAVYDLAAPSLPFATPSLPSFPTQNDITNLFIGAGIFAVPYFL